MLSEEQFWQIIQQAASEDRSRYIHNLEAELRRLTPQEIYEFQNHLSSFRMTLFTEEIIGIFGGPGDHFDDTCNAVIAAGRDAYNNVLSHPEKIVEFDEFEAFYNCAPQIYEELTGQSMD